MTLSHSSSSPSSSSMQQSSSPLHSSSSSLTMTSEEQNNNNTSARNSSRRVFISSFGSPLSTVTTSAPTLSPHDQCLHSHFAQHRAEIVSLYKDLDTTGKGHVTLGDLTQAIKMHGLDPAKNGEVRALLQDLVNKSRHRADPYLSQKSAEKNGDLITADSQMGPSVQRLSNVTSMTDTSRDLESIRVSFDDFFSLLSQEDGQGNIIQRAFMGKLAIPNWPEFCAQIVEIFEEVRANTGGRNADYIPQLSQVDPELYGCSVCTVDGQRFSVGNYDYEFTMQSCSKVFAYCIACDENSVQDVHRHIGFEPSGASFNAFTLDDRNLPHNPMINAGAIVNCSLIQPQQCASDRFTHVNRCFSDMAGGARISFDNATFLSEKDTADRNFALAYYMKEYGVFPQGTNLEETLDFYFQICSMLVSCEKLAVMASTLANAGVCPLTDKRVISKESVKCALQLMYSCGMYDYSGEWASTVGVPAKSGVSGAICVVIPGVLGLTIFSPRLDRRGNSVRGVDFCRRASHRFKWSLFDRMVEEEEDEEMSAVKKQILEYESTRAERDGSGSAVFASQTSIAQDSIGISVTSSDGMTSFPAPSSTSLSQSPPAQNRGIKRPRLESSDEDHAQDNDDNDVDGDGTDADDVQESVVPGEWGQLVQFQPSHISDPVGTPTSSTAFLSDRLRRNQPRLLPSPSQRPRFTLSPPLRRSPLANSRPHTTDSHQPSR